MEDHGWLKSEKDPQGGRNSRQSYVLTEEGQRILDLIRNQLKDLYREVINELEGESWKLHRKKVLIEIYDEIII